LNRGDVGEGGLAKLNAIHAILVVTFDPQQPPEGQGGFVYAKPTAPRSIGGVLDDSIRLYREGFGQSWPLALAAQLLVAVPMLYFRLTLVGAGTPSPQAMLALYRSPIFLATYVVGTVASIGFYNAIVLRLAAVFQGDAPPAGESLAAGFRLIPRVLLLFLLFAVVGGLVGGTFFLIFVYKGSLVAKIIAVSVGPTVVIYVIGRIFLANLVLVVERSGVFDSLRIGWVLTRGHWWRTATIYTVIVLIGLAFYFVIGLVAAAIIAIMGPVSAGSAALTELVSAIGTSALVPLFSATLLCIYYDLKLRKEGADLSARVSALAPQ
jgi:hypothetical protein